MKYAPKGSMCCECDHAKESCGSLNFSAMRPIRTDGEWVTVVCSAYEKTKIATEK